MRRDQIRVAAIVLAGCLFPIVPVQAQQKVDPTDSSTFKVEFNIRESGDASGKSSRRYTMLINSNGKGVFHSGSRVPYSTGSSQPAVIGAATSQQYTYLDLGVNIDCRLRELTGNKVVLNADIEISALAPHDKTLIAVPPNPTIAAVRLGINTTVDSGKPTLVASIDDPMTPRKFDVEAIVTKAN